MASPEASTMAELQLQGLRRTYANGVTAVDGIDLTVRDGEFMVLVGPSGCGKSTTLRMIAGLEDITAGRLRIGGEDMTHVAPADRGVAMVFQSYALYPHMTVAENMGFALRIAGRPRHEVDAAVGRAAEALQLAHLLDRKPRALSGGQRQRVAIGRAIVREPKVFLFDEPLSNLDASLRTQMRLEMARLHERLGTTVVYVTHDQVEAMTLGDRIAVFNTGRIEQVGTPSEVYRRPVNQFVAGFLGAPRMNFLPARASQGSAGASLEIAGAGRLALPAGCDAPLAAVRMLGVRPEHWQLGAPGGDQGLAAEVDRVEWLGDVTLVHCRLAGQAAANADGGTIAVKTGAQADAALRGGTPVRLHVQPHDLMLFDAQGRALAA
jgi:multiple sugar transport system ATP-binding protein